jgi:iron complex outermembrane receptor protein
MKRISVSVTLLIMALCINALAQNKGTIKGIIRDEKTSETLIGTTVALKGSGMGTVTDGSGGFMLPYSGEYPVTLIISYLGYNTQEYVLDSNKEVIFFLQPSTAAMREVVVSARRRKEVAQEIAIPISVLGAPQIENSVSFNVNRVKELVPSVQLYSSNPRNTTLNIRGLGSTHLSPFLSLHFSGSAVC